MVVLPCVGSPDWARILTCGQDRARLSCNDRKDTPMTVARQLAAFLTAAKSADLPDTALDYAAMVIASTLASAAFGTGIESARIIRAMAQERGGRGDAPVWFDAGQKLPAASAIQVNAVLSDAAASDDSDLRNIVHAGTPLTAAALAFAEREGGSGEAVLTAIVLGYEAAGRISEAMTPGFKDRGFHGCLGAAFGSAVASARMLNLDAERMAQTIALTAVSIGGLATAADTSVSREYHAGLAAMHGANAALAAQRGYVGEARILEAHRGFFEAFGGVEGAVAGEVAVRDPGRAWDIMTDMAIKLVPGGHPYHAIAEAAGNATREAGIGAEQIASITIHRPGMKALSGPLHPADLIDMAHSPAYFAAAGAADRGFSWDHAGPAKIADKVIQALIDKVSVGAEPTENLSRYRQGATVSVHTRDGRTVSNTVFEPKGSAALGLSWDDIDAKYRTLMPASGLPEREIELSLTLIHDLRKVADVSRLTNLLRVAAN
jgi:2-methylcitrate dehydratase PrpD